MEYFSQYFSTNFEHENIIQEFKISSMIMVYDKIHVFIDRVRLTGWENNWLLVTAHRAWAKYFPFWPNQTQSVSTVWHILYFIYFPFLFLFSQAQRHSSFTSSLSTQEGFHSTRNSLWCWNENLYMRITNTMFTLKTWSHKHVQKTANKYWLLFNVSGQDWT